MKKYFFIFLIILASGILFFGFEKVKAQDSRFPLAPSQYPQYCEKTTETEAKKFCVSSVNPPVTREQRIEGDQYYCCAFPKDIPTVPTKDGQAIPIIPPAEKINPPVINSINQIKSPPETTITIIGDNFNEQCLDFVIYFIENQAKQKAIPKLGQCSFQNLTVEIPGTKIGQAVEIQVEGFHSKKISNSKAFMVATVTPPSASGAGTTIGTQKTGKLQVDWPGSPLGDQLTATSTITNLIKYLYGWGISLGGFAAFIALVIAGVQYLTSAGNPGKMTEAMSRIRSAAIGLVLLLSSVLILNTINPRLTQLKIPDIAVPSPPITLDLGNPLKEFNKPCEGADLFSSIHMQGNPSRSLVAGNSAKDISITVGSVEIKDGQCQLKLYQRSNLTEEADKPAISISADTMNVGSLGTTEFRSYELIDLYNPSAQEQFNFGKKPK